MASQKIIKQRKLKGLTQHKLAELAGVNLRTIQRIENSKNEPRGQTLQLICDALDLDVEDLRTVDDGTSVPIGKRIANIFFLTVFNMSYITLISYMNFDHGASVNSYIASILLSFLIPAFIVYNSRFMSGLERLLKFGSGCFIFMIIILINFRLSGITLKLAVPSIMITAATLYFGSVLFKLNQTEE
ncbi:helix-turn-helix domain-containing protein [Nonlabens ponticola]|nr:helix-turn-helix transcriptional regulator [Nonlabens ponticola]